MPVPDAPPRSRRDRLRRFLPAAAGAALLGLTACSPAQTAAWLDWHSQDPEAASEWAREDCGQLCTHDTNHNGVVEPDGGGSAPARSEESREESRRSSPTTSSSSGGNSGGTCGQWRSTALDAGWSADQWPWVARIMYRESNCQPSAYNQSGASGLMQVMADWADNCGGSRSDLFSPWFNLHCARQIYSWQGPDAWSTN